MSLFFSYFPNIYINVCAFFSLCVCVCVRERERERERFTEVKFNCYVATTPTIDYEDHNHVTNKWSNHLF